MRLYCRAIVALIFVALIFSLMPVSSSALSVEGASAQATRTPAGLYQRALNLPAICYPLKKVFLPLVVRNAGGVGQAFASAIRVTPSPIHAVRVSYNNLSLSRPEVPALQANLTRVSANFVALSAGRPDWTYFKWTGHETWWSSEVTDDQRDYLAEDIANYGAGRHVNAIVDIFAPHWIIAHPADAAVFYTGVYTSPVQVSTAALVNGAYGWHVLEMIGYMSRLLPCGQRRHHRTILS